MIHMSVYGPSILGQRFQKGTDDQPNIPIFCLSDLMISLWLFKALQCTVYLPALRHSRLQPLYKENLGVHRYGQPRERCCFVSGSHKYRADVMDSLEEIADRHG
jgi:hypothetical protein